MNVDRMQIKLNWTKRMAYASLGLLLFVLTVNYFREPILGIKKGYAPHNLSFSFIFFIPLMLTSLILGVMVIGRTIKHWNHWVNLNDKLKLFALSFPVVGLWIFQIIRIIIM